MSPVPGPLRAGFCMAAVVLLGTPAAAAAVPAHCAPSLAHSSAAVTTLHVFAGGSADGKSPTAGLVFDRAGTTLYGTAQFGGEKKKGTVFALDPVGAQTTVPHSFGNVASTYRVRVKIIPSQQSWLPGTLAHKAIHFVRLEAMLRRPHVGLFGQGGPDNRVAPLPKGVLSGG